MIMIMTATMVLTTAAYPGVCVLDEPTSRGLVLGRRKLGEYVFVQVQDARGN